MTATQTTDSYRDKIDSGETGDKVAFPDPAAAPLGTDDEAGGSTPEVPPTTAPKPTANAAGSPKPNAPAPVIYGTVAVLIGVALIVVAGLALA